MNVSASLLPPVVDLRRRAGELTARAGTGRTSATAYDTAFFAALRSPHDPSVRLFPAAVSWLRSHQHSDGSWGAVIPHAHDRLVSTLAAVTALVEIGESWAHEAITRAVEFIGREAGSWTQQYPDTIGFELVTPQLLECARRVGLPLPYEVLRPIELRRSAKLAKIPPELLFEPAANISFSSEFLAGSPADQLRRLKTANGSYACSPSASASAWSTTGDPDTWAYLQHVAAACGDGGVPAIFPMEVFDRAWVLEPLATVGLLGPRAPEHARFLISALGVNGAAASQVGPAPDSDTTAMSILAAQSAGEPCSAKLDSLLRYESADHFRCFDFERDPSVSANARVRHALVGESARFGPQIGKADAFLADVREARGFWHDKWHLSPYYTTAVVVAGGRHRPWQWDRTRAWLLDTQHRDGSWGAFLGTREETAYAITMLGRLTDAGDHVAVQAIARGGVFLSTAEPVDPELWIAKSLYTPLHVVEAYVLAAQAVAIHRLREAA